ncbi:potassium ABC transporter ATPase [Imbroritus primus]|jgi:hypothetical protein
MDIFYLAALAAFMVLVVALVRGCQRLAVSGERS